MRKQRPTWREHFGIAPTPVNQRWEQQSKNAVMLLVACSAALLGYACGIYSQTPPGVFK